ncbi:MAG: hypothetical protein K6D94_12590 [Clostridiales bacterium]|nr:hypothetical protein [Clostridiales bacterium]
MTTIQKCGFFLSILSVAVMLTSCGADTSEDTIPAQDNTDDTTSQTTEEAVESIPLYDFEGSTFSFLVPTHETPIYESHEIAVAELNGNAINDAVYNRNLMISSVCNVSITAEINKDVTAKGRALILAGDTSYQVYMPYLNGGTALMQEGLLNDLYQFDGLHLDRNWWDQCANEGLRIGNKLFFSTGDISIIDDYCAVILYFNKKLVKDFGLDDPYTLVKDRKWTMDKVFEYADVYVDINGDSVKDKNDLYGLGLTNPAFLWYSCGMTIASRDGSGNITVDLGTEKNAAVVSVLTDFFQSGKEGLFWPDWQVARDSFKNNALILYTSALGNLALYMNTFDDVEFGLLPLPMLDENQDDYHTLVSTVAVPGVSIPNHLDRETASEAATLCDIIARYSTDTVRHEFYDIALHDRYFSDEESGEMLDIIFQTRVYDLGWIYNWGSVTGLFAKLKNGNTFASDYEAIKPAIETSLQETIVMAENMINKSDS